MVLLELRKCTVYRGIYLCNSILVVTEIFCYRKSRINNFGNNNIFLPKFGDHFIPLWGLSVRNFIQIRSNLTFLLFDV